jgi:hypothetical protein
VEGVGGVGDTDGCDDGGCGDDDVFFHGVVCFVVFVFLFPEHRGLRIQ